MTLLNKSLTCLLFSGIIFVAGGKAQTPTETPKRVNFGYSQNPKTKNKTATPENKVKEVTIVPAALKNESSEKPNAQTALITENASEQKTSSEEKTVSEQKTNSEQKTDIETPSIAAKTLEIAKRASVAATSPSEIYKVGVGDVLFISLQNAPAKESTYFTVLNDGTIDYPLAGEMISVVDLTTEEIEDLLKEKVKLYENPQISVKIREHASHSITVLGLVAKAGEKFLQREAIPLYVVKAEAVVEPRANQVFIKHLNSNAETVSLNDAKSDDILIFPGDILEFKASQSVAASEQSAQFYYIGGEIVSAGQKDFHSGITLTQAILASGGLRKSNAKKVIVRRKNEQGLLSPTAFDLNAIKDGKQPDPTLQAGDTIEITKN
ncbi:MAG: polysaccharide biosynthesis/export family protein [Acidobacteriota bacterium]|nr:polysaccharide biosynthesis/export family protein [Acidobacteriota bacterium]